MKLKELITEALGNVKFTSDMYIQQACLALESINGEVDWDENRQVITVCNIEILACGINVSTGTVSFKVMGIILEYPLVDTDAIKVVAMTEQLAEEQDYLNEITQQIHKLENVYGIDDLCVDISAVDGCFDISTEDLSTDTMVMIRDAVINDLSVAHKEKMKFIHDLEIEIAELHAKIKASHIRVNYRWSLATPCMWASFDYGVVEASSIEEARELSLADLKDKIRTVNEILKPHGYSIETNYEIDVVLEENSN